MAGSALRNLETQKVPDNSVVVGYTTETTELLNHIMFIAPFRCKVEQITFRYITAPGGNLDIRAARVASGAAETAGTELSSAFAIYSGGDTLNLAVDTNQDLTITTTENILDAGESLVIRLSAADTALAGLSVTAFVVPE